MVPESTVPGASCGSIAGRSGLATEVHASRPSPSRIEAAVHVKRPVRWIAAAPPALPPGVVEVWRPKRQKRLARGRSRVESPGEPGTDVERRASRTMTSIRGHSPDLTVPGGRGTDPRSYCHRPVRRSPPGAGRTGSVERAADRMTRQPSAPVPCPSRLRRTVVPPVVRSGSWDPLRTDIILTPTHPREQDLQRTGGLAHSY